MSNDLMVFNVYKEDKEFNDDGTCDIILNLIKIGVAEIGGICY